ncbi:AAA family ATPase [Piscinibacter sp. XHJ-5]|uniref:ATP-binding protein n=1 Tax=Piscinibacter sp. XHJ-5 TaxID=3037797 RepID=UPI002452959B|nr:AAA family ATPase [Piscinibacter sp. XHJ-5]
MTHEIRTAAPAALRFGPYQLEPANALLLRGQARLDLPPKAFAVLCHLAARPGQLVSKEELLDAVWGRRFVSESVIKSAVNTIRDVLGDDPRAPRYVETVARRGYRFVVPASAAPAIATAAAAPAAPEPAAQAGTLVGRDAPLAQLVAALAGVQAGASTLVWVGGEAGVGKTALIERFRGLARQSGAWLASGQCIEQSGGGEPLLPLLDALAELTRGPDGSAWVAALRQRAPSWLAALPWLAGATPESAGSAAESSGAAPERMLRELGILLDAMTAARPLVLVVEDLHWSDHATVSLLGYLARRRGPARWLAVATFRHTEAALGEHPLQALRLELRAQRLCQELALDSFSEVEVDRYLGHRFAPAAVQERSDLAQALHAHTEGLPLFVVSVVDELVANRQLQPGDHGWRLSAHAWSTLQVPDTITGVVERQIAKLPGPLRALLEAASVLGFEFAHDLLAALTGEAPEALRARCDGLARRGEWLVSAGMVERGDGALAFRYAFRHVLYQRVLYERAAPAQRLQQHLAAAQALASGTLPERHAAELAHHHERACDIALAGGARPAGMVEEARRWRLAAARAARALHALDDAIAHYTRALELDPPPQEQARVLGERSELLRLAGDGPAALRDSARAWQLARGAGDAALCDTLQLTHARVCMFCDEVKTAIELADELLARRLPDAQRIDALLVKARSHRLLGQPEPAGATLDTALAAAPQDHIAQRAAIAEEMVHTLFERGAHTEGLRVAEQAQALFERCGDRAGAARALIRIGVLSLNLHRRAQAQAALEEARQRLGALGDVDGQRSALLNLVKLHSDHGDADTALALLEEGWNLSPQFESPVAECAFLNGFYYCNYLRGDLGAACRDAERVLALAAQLSSIYWRVGSAVLVTDLFIFLGDWTQARRLTDEALALLETRGEQALRARVAARSAWLDTLQGRSEAALDRLDALGTVETAEDRAVMDRVRAQARFDLGDASGALDVLAAYDHAPTLEAWTQMLALRLQAQVTLDRIDERDLQRAEADLKDPCLPALEGLWLRRVFAHALAVAGRADAARDHGERYGRERARLAESLRDWPALRASFLARSAPL